MEYFWTHRDNMPEGLGYGQFKTGHFIWIGITLLLVAAIVFMYARSGDSRRVSILRTIGAVLIFIDIIKMILIARSDVDLLEYLPLEICSFAAYFIVCDSIWIGNKVFPMMLLTLFLPAAIMAVLFPTTSACPAFNFYTIHQFLYHGLIIAYVLSRFVCKEIPLTYPDVWRSIFRIILLASVIYVVDTLLNRNYMFLRGTYGNPLLEVIWNVTGGGFAYTLGLVAFCIIMIHVFYGFFSLIRFLFLR